MPVNSRRAKRCSKCRELMRWARVTTTWPMRSADIQAAAARQAISACAAQPTASWLPCGGRCLPMPRGRSWASEAGAPATGVGWTVMRPAWGLWAARATAMKA